MIFFKRIKSINDKYLEAMSIQVDPTFSFLALLHSSATTLFVLTPLMLAEHMIQYKIQFEAKKKYSKDPILNRNFKAFKDKDLIWVMNNIAMQDNNQTTDIVAQQGGEIKYSENEKKFLEEVARLKLIQYICQK